MLETSARLLRLLSLLQARGAWTGPELAERLKVSERTVRNDIERLRTLGYPVEAGRGSVGGYWLGAGASMPPLLLSDEEAVVLVLALRAATGIAGLEEVALQALAKLEQILPSRLRRRVAALTEYAINVPTDVPGPLLDTSLLSDLAALCRDTERLRMDYQDHNGRLSRRDVEPHRLVSWGRRWYLLGWDRGADEWRIFRVDRIRLRSPTGPRFTPRQLPEEDVAAYVSRRVSAAAWRYQTSVIVHAPAATVAARLPAAAGTVEPRNAKTCIFHTGADSVETIAAYLGLLDHDFEITGPPELVERIDHLAHRYARATGGHRGGRPRLYP